MPWLQKPPLGTPIRFDHPLAKGLMGCWLFNENGGDKAYDLSGNGNHGTLTGMSFPPTATSGWNPGKFGSALAFVTNDYVNCGTIPLVSGLTSYTLSGLFKRVDISSDQTIYAEGSSASNTPLVCVRLTATGVVYFEHRSNVAVDADVSSNSANYDDNKWHHFSAVRVIANSFRLYIESILQTDIATESPGATTTDRVAIGLLNRLTPYGYFGGCIDHLLVHDRALAEEEVRQLYYEPFAMFQERKVYYFIPAEAAFVPKIIFM